MTGKEALYRLTEYINRLGGDETLEEGDVIFKALEILETLKPRIHLKEGKLKNAFFTIDENGLPKIESDVKEVDVVFIEASGFVIKNRFEHQILKEWLDNDK